MIIETLEVNHIMVVLNKLDLFLEAIKTHRFSDYFKEFKGEIIGMKR